MTTNVMKIISEAISKTISEGITPKYVQMSPEMYVAVILEIQTKLVYDNNAAKEDRVEINGLEVIVNRNMRGYRPEVLGSYIEELRHGMRDQESQYTASPQIYSRLYGKPAPKKEPSDAAQN